MTTRTSQWVRLPRLCCYQVRLEVNPLFVKKDDPEDSVPRAGPDQSGEQLRGAVLCAPCRCQP